MKKETIERIRENGTHPTVIGAYTYKCKNDGSIIRCKTTDIGREWIDDDDMYDAWETI